MDFHLKYFLKLENQKIFLEKYSNRHMTIGRVAHITDYVITSEEVEIVNEDKAETFIELMGT